MKSKVKKILSVFLIISLVFSLAACGTKTDVSDDDSANVQDTSAPTENTVVDEGSNFDEYEEDDTQETTEVEKPEFGYKMVDVYEKTSTKYDVKQKEFCFVIEFMTTGYNANSFDVYNKDGKELKDVRMSRYAGNICTTDDIKHIEKYDGGREFHRAQYTLVLFTENMDYSIDDIVIGSEVQYIYDYTTKIDVKYEPNAELSDLTTQHKYVHGPTVFNIEGSYFLFDDNHGRGWGDYSVYNFTDDMKLLSEGPVNTPKGKAELVDENGELIKIPGNYKIHFAFNEKGYQIGLEDTNMSDEIPEEYENLVFESFLKYTDTEGNSTIFFAY